LSDDVFIGLPVQHLVLQPEIEVGPCQLKKKRGNEVNNEEHRRNMYEIENKIPVDKGFGFVLRIDYQAPTKGGKKYECFFHVLFVYEIDDILIFFMETEEEKSNDDPRGSQQHPVKVSRHVREHEVGAFPEQPGGNADE
jgi:hypothetical protein